MRRRTQVSVAGSVVLIAAAVFGFLWMNQPSVSRQTVEYTPEVKAATTSGFRARYFSTELPDSLVLRSKVEDNAQGALARYMFQNSRVGDSRQLAITVSTLPTGGLAEVADVNFRVHNTERYSEFSLPDTTTGARAFRATDGYEVAVFYPNDGVYASIVLSGRVESTDELDADYLAILSHWQWL